MKNVFRSLRIFVFFLSNRNFMVFYYGAVVITKEIGRGQDPSMTLQIQVENVVCSLKPCSMCQPRTELNFGNPHAIIYVQVVVRDLQNCKLAGTPQIMVCSGSA